jgi:hypothetical protein
MERRNGEKALVCSLRRNPGLTLRKAGNLDSGRLTIFSRETLHHFFKLVRQPVDADLRCSDDLAAVCTDAA